MTTDIARKHQRIEVRWIGGQREVWQNIAANQLVTLSEGPGMRGQE